MGALNRKGHGRTPSPSFSDVMSRPEFSARKNLFHKPAIRIGLLLLLVLLGSATFASAQTFGVSPYFGLGSARDSAGTSAAEGCPAGQLFDGVICEAAPTMGGLFAGLGVNVMFRKHLGIDGEYALHVRRVPYLPDDSLDMRPMFYDLNALWEPFSGKGRFIPFLEGGFGGAKVKLYFTQPTSLTGINSLSGFSAGSDTSHFQLHGAIGMKVYLHGNLFVKPQFDIHYATHLTDEFGRNTVLQYMVYVGYTFGQR